VQEASVPGLPQLDTSNDERPAGRGVGCFLRIAHNRASIFCAGGAFQSRSRTAVMAPDSVAFDEPRAGMKRAVEQLVRRATAEKSGRECVEGCFEYSLEEIGPRSSTSTVGGVKRALNGAARSCVRSRERRRPAAKPRQMSQLLQLASIDSIAGAGMGFVNCSAPTRGCRSPIASGERRTDAPYFCPATSDASDWRMASATCGQAAIVTWDRTAWLGRSGGPARIRRRSDSWASSTTTL